MSSFLQIGYIRVYSPVALSDVSVGIVLFF